MAWWPGGMALVRYDGNPFAVETHTRFLRWKKKKPRPTVTVELTADDIEALRLCIMVLRGRVIINPPDPTLRGFDAYWRNRIKRLRGKLTRAEKKLE